ncbi:MAG TPA: type VI secretion system tube protein Hcp [Burkholderiales bacterium]|nr:type VI secretion system tube protein Hcp [Burkholderiales bacterium]
MNNEEPRKRLPALAVKSLMAGAAGLGLMAAEPALAVLDAFLDIPGIPGESQDSKHKGEIDVLSYTHTFTQGEKVKGVRGNCSPVQIVKFLDRATPALALGAVTGQTIPTMTLTLRKAGDKSADFYNVTMQDVIVVSTQVNEASGDDKARETVSFSPGSVTIVYRPANPDGSLGAAVSEAVSCATGK